MIDIYLSNNGTSWSDSYQSGKKYHSVVENSGMNLFQQVNFGNATSNKMTINVSGNEQDLAPFKNNKYIKIIENSTALFYGINSSIEENVISADFRELAINYDDWSSQWNELKVKDIESTEYEESFMIPCPAFSWNKTKIVDAIDIMLDEYDTLIESEDSTDLDMLNTLEKERDYWDNLKSMYNGDGSTQILHKVLIIEGDDYTVCNPSSTSKSLVHYLFSLLPNKPTGMTVHCGEGTTISDTVKFFRLGSETVLIDAIAETLTQNGLGWYIDYGSNTIEIVSFDHDTVASVIDKIESGATIRTSLDKEDPYEQDDYRYVSGTIENTSKVGAIASYSQGVKSEAIFSYPRFATEYYDTSSIYYPCLCFPNRTERYCGSNRVYAPQIGHLDSSEEIVSSREEISSNGFVKFLKGILGINNIKEQFFTVPSDASQTDYSNISAKFNDEVQNKWEDKYIPLVCKMNDDNSIDYLILGRETGIPWQSVYNDMSNARNIGIFADIRYPKQSTVDRAKDTSILHPTGDTKMLSYVYSASGVARYRRANVWYKESKNKSWEFHSPNSYNLLDTLKLLNVDEEYVIIIKKQRNLYDGTYKYTCVAEPKADIKTGQGIVTGETVEVTTEFDYRFSEMSASYVNGVLQGDANIHLYVTCRYSVLEPSVTYGGVQYEANRYGDGTSWVIDIPKTVVSSDIIGSITVSDSSGASTTNTFVLSEIRLSNGTDGSYVQYQFAIGTRTSYPTNDEDWYDVAPTTELGDNEYVWQRWRTVQP